MISSNHHIEMAPGDAGLNDRYVIQDVIKEMAQNKNIANVGSSSSGAKDNHSIFATNDTKNNNNDDESNPAKKKVIYKVVVLVEVDKLTRQAQAALRRTMEKYSSSCRLILCCNNPSKVIDPVRSRCLGIRVAAPSHDEVRVIMAFLSIAAGVSVFHSFPLLIRSEPVLPYSNFIRSAQS